jgi:hypothetical protein
MPYIFLVQNKRFKALMNEVYNGEEPVPTMEELLRRVSYLFVDTQPLLDFSRPVPSQVYLYKKDTLTLKNKCIRKTL